MSQQTHEKASLEATLEHYGVKGMKWGVRRTDAQLDAANANYTSRKRANDRRQYGKKGEARINRSLNEGKTRTEAQRKEDGRVARRHIARGAAVAAIYLYATSSTQYRHPNHRTRRSEAASYIGNRAQTMRGQRAARDAMSRTHGLGSGPREARYRRGAFNISSF